MRSDRPSSRSRAVAHASHGAALVATLVVFGCAGEDPATGYEPGEERPGGETTNEFLLGTDAFGAPAANITDAHRSQFFSGNSFFNQGWVQAPASTKSRDGLGPLYNARSCSACHFKDGRGQPPSEQDGSELGLLFRLSVPGEGAHGGVLPDEVYGGQLQPFAIAGVPAEGRMGVSYEIEAGTFADGEPYELRVPRYRIEEPGYGPVPRDLRISPRIASGVYGMGLLEAIPEERLEELTDPEDVDADGISGRLHQVWSAERGAMATGRFGWKAEQPSLREQSAAAFLGDVGITSSLFPEQNCTASQPECADAVSGGDSELSERLLDRVEAYVRLLAVPGRKRFDDPEVLRGKALFHELGCATCHVPSHRTRKDEGVLLELRDQEIWPYTDMLLHDMGKGLSDGRPVFGASGREWRTPALWGLRLYKVVNGHDTLLHDGRARGVAEAILWHGGEADAAARAFRELSAEERQALVVFVESL